MNFLPKKHKLFLLVPVVLVGIAAISSASDNSANAGKSAEFFETTPRFEMENFASEADLDSMAEMIHFLPSHEESELLERIDSSVWDSPDLYRDERYDELFDGGPTSSSSSTSTSVFEYTSTGGLKSKNAFCHRFIEPEGKLGVYGAIINHHLDQKYIFNPSTPLLSDDFVGMEKAPKVCPNWRELSFADRKKFLIWTFAAIAHYESSCGGNPRTETGVRGMPITQNGKIVRYKTAIGLLQIEKALRDRSFRGIESCNISEKEIAKAPGNLRCGVDLMEWLLVGSERRPPAPIYRGPGMRKASYWEKLRQENGGAIGILMRKFKPCFSTKS